MSKVAKCPQCVDRDWKYGTRWFDKLANWLHLKVPHLLVLLPTLVATLSELNAMHPFMMKIFIILAAPFASLAFVGLMLFFRRVIVGTRFHMFRIEGDPRLHLHHSMVYIGSPGEYWVDGPDGRRCELKGPVLSLKLGGIFRRNRILRNARGNWSAVGGHGGNVRVSDMQYEFLIKPYGNHIESSPQEIFDLISRYPSVERIWGDARAYRIDYTKLGEGVSAVHQYLQESKGAEKSKVGQHARELLRQVILSVAENDDEEKWQSQVKKTLPELEKRLAIRKKETAHLVTS